jgi:gliding motility-associated-like protein
VASPTVTTKYYVTATTGVCTQLDSITISVRPAPVPDAGADIAVCFGKTIQLSGGGGVTFQWSPETFLTTPSNIPDPSLKAKEDITYSLMVVDANGCASLVPDEIFVDVTPSVRIFAGNDTIVAINQPLQLKVVEIGNAGVTSFSWSPITYLDDPASTQPIATLPHDFNYIVTGTTAEGCEGVDEIRIKVYKGPDIYVPTAFTPNSDGLNDVLIPVPVGIKELKHFRIFNRWGQIVFATNVPSQGWDGKIKGQEQPSGTFIWTAEAVDYLGNNIRKQGIVTILK